MMKRIYIEGNSLSSYDLKIINEPKKPTIFLK